MKTKKKDVSNSSRKSVETIKEQPIQEVKTEEVSHIHESREQLLALSHQVKPLVESGRFETINEAIVETCYRDEVHHEFKKYREWQKEGYQVRKGEKAFVLWGKPKEGNHHKEKEKVQPEATKKDELEDDAYTYYPVAYVFSDAQVMEIDRKALEELEHTRNDGRDETEIER